eukprot:TRINITY_DN6756_c0_g1_i2.p1 TRINITY_DN6756_c0_g1~~TRINITY_DN6756_c0_g1_i2.p1  ORF type:complete len:627 (+),score=150.12 TRINITY_DN6756_c0_g1_i2:484-2364(+)
MNIETVYITGAKIRGGNLGHSPRRALMEVWPGGAVMGMYVNNAGSFTLVGSSIYDFTAGTGSDLVFDDGYGPQDQAGEGGAAYGIYVNRVNNVLMSGVSVDQIQGGAGGSPLLDTDTVPGSVLTAGNGGEAVGIRLMEVQNAIIDTLSISAIGGGDSGEPTYISNLLGSGGRATGLSLRSSRVRELTPTTVWNYAAGAGSVSYNILARSIVYDDNTTYDTLDSVLPTIVTDTTTSFHFPSRTDGDQIMFTSNNNCSWQHRSALSGTTDFSLSRDEIMGTAFTLNSYGNVTLPFPLPVGNYTLCYMPADYILPSEPMARQSLITVNVIQSSPLLSSSSSSSLPSSSSSVSSAASSSSITSSSSSSSSSSYGTSTLSTSTTTGGEAPPLPLPLVIVQPIIQSMNVSELNQMSVRDGSNNVVAFVSIPEGSIPPDHFPPNDSSISSFALSAAPPAALLPLQSGSLSVVSAVMDLTITKTSGDSNNKSVISSFATPVFISFIILKSLQSSSTSSTSSSSSYDINMLCLGYYDEFNQTWLCEDANLIRNSPEHGLEFYSGQTSHFTSFAILVSSQHDSSSPPLSSYDGGGNKDDDGWSTNGGAKFIAVVVCGCALVAGVAIALFFVYKYKA